MRIQRPTHCTLTAIFMECDEHANGKHMLPERAEWFRGMLQNAILNAQDAIRTFEQVQDRLPEYGAAIVRKRAEIERIRSAIQQIS